MVIPPRKTERIKRRPLPDFNESELGLMSAIREDGFLNVALDDTNQYGPHAMIILLGLISSFTGLALLIAMKLL
ncbi:MAG: hypothetical protein HOJ64_04760 [Euryarchaeota archaeon]|jgi:hypothetical protein|nr:hypothetical protein [Euryarchaeota archaeon]MBT4391769.1 hypothetical protein [Euryarchaeota archaeon]MBT4802518.1 hypothetical protein [Euryarchaeota archaeon]MBT5614165.1 hypothetical protein [Euryarchaeota archaeon]MBT6684184.1 hypothetical protein [Euryarchaeota archaeon]